MRLEDQDWVINPNTGNKINMKQQKTDVQLALIYIDSNFPFFRVISQTSCVYVEFSMRNSLHGWHTTVV